MSLEDYRKAVKAGKKSLADKKGEELPVLDEILKDKRIAGEVPLGLVDIPADLIVGTKTRGRTSAFAPNFMPIFEEGSEFSMKWINLCNAHLEEGIRDPIIAYEYMNKYYVMEGNKRVSILKYFGNSLITGYVTRVLPARDDTKENHIYYEYVDFFNSTSINYLFFSDEYGYARINRLTGHSKHQRWSYDDRVDFRACYYSFDNIFKDLGGEKLPITTGDAFLIYLDIFGYEKTLKEPVSDTKDHLKKIWPEIKAYAQGEARHVTYDPSPDPEANTVVAKILPPAISKKPLDKKAINKIAFIHFKNADTSGWTYGHELGRNHVQDVFRDKIQTTAYNNVTLENAWDVIMQAITDGNKIIFSTTPQLYDVTLKAAMENPDIKFLNCSLNQPHRFIRTYYGRMFEAKLLTGVLAGILTKTERIGYIADYPIYGAAANINAFALGVRSVRPDAKIYLEWSTIEENKGVDLVERFLKLGIDYISFTDSFVPGAGERKYGLCQLRADGSLQNIAYPIWDWGRYYERIIRNIALGTWNNEAKEISSKTQAYWWGMSSGVIDLFWSPDIPSDTAKLLGTLFHSVKRYELDMFRGRLVDQDGVERCSADQDLGYEEIVYMDWLLDNIVGYIPKPKDMQSEAKQVVETDGLLKEEE